MSEQGRGARTPRTLFSLGRPGAGAPADAPEPEVVDEVPAEEPTDVGVEEEIVAYCANCGAGLTDGIPACPSCDTPILWDDEEDEAEEPTASADEAVDPDAPAAVLYADRSQAEPLPPPVEESWGISEPESMSADELLAQDEAEAASAEVEEPDEAAVAGAAGAVLTAELLEEESGDLAGDDFAEEPVAETEPDAEPEPEPEPEPEAEAEVVPGQEPVNEPAAEVVDETIELDETPAGDDHDAGVLVGAGVAGAATGGVAAATSSTSTAAPAKSGGSKTGIIIGVVAAVLVLGVVAALALGSGGSKKDDTATSGNGQSGAVTPSSQASSTTSSASSSSASSTESTTTTAPSTTETTTAPSSSTPATTTAPVTTNPPVTTPVSTLPQPANITASPGNGNVVTVGKAGSFTVTLTNSGGGRGAWTLSGQALTVSQGSGNLEPGQSTTVTVSANSTFEGSTNLRGVFAGTGTYNLGVFVKNG